MMNDKIMTTKNTGALVQDKSAPRRGKSKLKLATLKRRPVVVKLKSKKR